MRKGTDFHKREGRMNGESNRRAEVGGCLNEGPPTLPTLVGQHGNGRRQHRLTKMKSFVLCPKVQKEPPRLPIRWKLNFEMD
ncbi:hypothetical protein JTE90_003148 [Oedothorax gibbosus]|uniref:Uncharacterized protein n=1 Tax=Oedothorax gibbosus TaxID=931172 RepID=A0AAV6UAD9_9ARAC|nr:hypothetical protein JTE90_003148 [Oedothorax gibbosus]